MGQRSVLLTAYLHLRNVEFTSGLKKWELANYAHTINTLYPTGVPR